MKTLIRKLVLLAAATAALCTATAHEKKIPGPHGGRLLTSVSPHVEFLVTADRRVQLTVVDDAGEPVAPATQSVTVVTGSRSAPTTLTFSRQGDVLVSNAPLPEGRIVPTIVRLKPAPDAAEVIERFNVNLATCPECKHAEYACICHGH